MKIRNLSLVGLVLFAFSIAGISQTFRGGITGTLTDPSDAAILGAAVILMEGWSQIARYGETWQAYRTASESIKREQRLFINGAAQYRGLDDEEAFLRFVESVETLIAREQQIFWSARRFDEATDSGATRKS